MMAIYLYPRAMKVRTLSLTLLIAGVLQGAQAKPKAVMSEKHWKLFENYCIACHDEETQKGKLNLEGLASVRMSRISPKTKPLADLILREPHCTSPVMKEEKTPLFNLWLSTLRGSGVQADSFGDSTGIVEELFTA